MTARPQRLEFEDWRCVRCQRVLAKVNRDGIRDHATVVEIRCRKCGVINYLTSEERPIAA